MALEARKHATTRSDSAAPSWADRCAYWLRKHDKARRPLRRRERETRPLVLAGHGLSIRVDKGALLIRDGNTHYPAAVRTHRYFRGGFDTPPRIVAVDGSGEITLDALDWMHEQGVTFIRLDWRGEVISVASPNGFAGDPEKVAWQRDVAADPAKSVAFASDLISRKLMASIDTLVRSFQASDAREAAIESARAVVASLKTSPPKSIRDLLMIEAQEAVKYFRVWRQLKLNWRGKVHPVPRTWEGFEARNVESDALNPRNKNARHPVNAILNYAYAALESRLRIETVAEGYDPTQGILHTSSKGVSSFVFDLMEPERPRVDATVLRLIMEQRLTGADFTIRSDGVCRLNPEMARKVAQAVDS